MFLKTLRAPRSAFHNQRGQALIESVVAVSVLTVGLLGILALLSQSLGLNRSVSENYAATYLAAEGIEVVKNMIDANSIQGRAWASGLADGTYEVSYESTSLTPNQGRYLTFDAGSGLYGYSGGQTTPFERTITLTNVPPGELKVVARVAWTTRGGGSFDVVLENHFYKWRQ